MKSAEDRSASGGMIVKSKLLAGSALAWALAPSMVCAQSDTPAPQASEPSTSAAQPVAGVPDIVITAQRRSENLQRAAIAVSAISGDALEAAGITRPAELTAVIPSLQVVPAAGPYNLFYLRGVGNFNGNSFSDAAVAFNFDGVYLSRPSATTGFFYDLERVEVVKGPQGTLYGRNATGGAINVISRRPDFNRFGLEASVEYGNHDALRLDGAINVPVGDRAAFRFAGIYVSHDGFLNDGTDDQKDWGARASFRIEPAPNLRISATADYFHQGAQGPGATPLGAVNGVATPTTFNLDDRIGFLSPQGQAFYTGQRNTLLGRNFYAIPASQNPFQDNDYWGISATVDWETSIGTFTIIPAYREGSLDYRSYVPGFYIRQREETNQTSLEARFATSEEHPLRVLLGSFYFNDSATDPFVAYIHQSNGSFQNNIDLGTESVAVFGRLTYAVTPELRFSVGARQTWEEKSFTGNLLSVSRICAPLPFTNCPVAPQIPYDPFPPALVPPGQVIVPPLGPPPYGGLPDPAGSPALIQVATPIVADQRANWDRLTWRVAADWDVTPRNLLYVSYETGFKAGGFFFSADQGVYNPENIRALTIGSKNRFFDNRLQVNVELFHWRYRGQQISHLTFDSVGTPIFATENVGRASFKGVEVELRLAATDTTTLTADVQYLDARYSNFIYTTPNQNGGFFNGTGCPNGAAPALVYTIDCSGRRPPNAPKWTINFGGQQRIPVSFGEFVIDARAHFQSQTLTGLEFLPVEYQDSHWLIDAAITYYAPQRRYYLGAFVNNMFDEAVLANTFPTPFSSFYTASIRPPRTYGLRAGVNF
jgi:iron complex outermembrane receptor protein